MKTEKKVSISHLIINIILSIIIVCYPGKGLAEDNPESEVANRYGLAAVLGNTYDPTNDIGFYMISGFALYDYDRVWPHRAPEPLRFKIELSIGGAAVEDSTRLIASFGVLALYYLDNVSNNRFRPYLEAGIGAIYTDFQVEGQGLRFNFNPQIGFGTEIRSDSGTCYFANMRLHHVSNGGLDDDNRSINSVVFMLGRFF